MRRNYRRPTPLEVKTAREAAGLTQLQAAEIIYVSRATWQKWEADLTAAMSRTMSVEYYELFLLKTQSCPEVLPGQVKAVREALGLSLRDAAAMVHSFPSVWQKWEEGVQAMPPALFQHFRAISGYSKSGVIQHLLI